MHAPRWLAAPILALCAGCIVESAPRATVVVAQGQLVIDWTIDGVKDANKCAQAAVSTIEVVIRYANGAEAGTYQQSCGAFSTSIALYAGDYRADATLLDAKGSARTTTIPIQPFTIRGNDTLSVPIDFPASSFFGPT
jgi:hypothetical protein